MTNMNIAFTGNTDVLGGKEGDRAAQQNDAFGAGYRRCALSLAITALFCAAAGVRPVSAQSVTASGNINPGTIQTSNWDISGQELDVGDSAVGDMEILGGGTVSNGYAYVGGAATGQGTVTVSGSDSAGHASTWTSSDQVNVGYDGIGSVLVEDGGVVNGGQTVIGVDSGAAGAVAVGSITVSGHDGSGHASTWTSSEQIFVGAGGTGTLLIEDGGVVNNDQSFIGDRIGSVGNATVTGIGSTWNSLDNIYVGLSGTGTLAVEDGATVNTIGSSGGGAAIYIGLNGDGNGTITVSSSNNNTSTLTATDRIEVGENGAGTLNIGKGGFASAGSDTFIAISSGSIGTLNLNGDASGRGVLETGSVIKGDGTAALNIDGGILRANRDEPDFLVNFTSLTVGSEGAWFDTNGHDIGIGTDFSGSSSLNKLGLGTLTLTGDSSIPTTVIAAGTLQLGDGGITGSVTGSVANSGTLAFDRSDVFDFDGTVTGSGSVNQMGSGTTVLTTANTYTGGTLISLGTLQLGNGGMTGSIVGDVVDNGTLAFDRSDKVEFRGVITGSGSVTQMGAGTTVLTATNTYTGGTLISTGTLQLGNGGTTGSIVDDIVDNGTLVFDRSNELDLASAISGSGAVNQIGDGMTVLNGVSSYSGGTNVVAGTLVVGDAAHANAAVGAGPTIVAAGATLGGYGTASGSVINAGTLAVANALPAFAAGTNGSFTVGGDLMNQGLVSLAATSGQIGNVLNVGGNYSGTNGQLVLNTLLNEGGAATKTDQLVVAGNAGGSTAIQVHGTGSGALTVGDGIKLVQVNGTSAANSFRLGNAVQGGAYEYLLYQGAAASANDWYLRSSIEAPPPTPDASGSGAAAAHGGVSPPPVAFRPGVAGYSMTPLLNADYGFTILGRLHERVGDIASVEAGQAGKDGAGNKDGIWARMSDGDLDLDSNDRFSADEHTFFAQFGKDWTLARGTGAGSTHAGLMMTFGSASATFDDNLRDLYLERSNKAGSVETHAQSLGGYWTKYLSDGTYFDGVSQFTHYYNKYGDVYSDKATQNGYGAGASAEVGKPFQLGSTSVAIEPQAQLLYQYLKLNSMDDGISSISGTNTSDLRARLGFRVFRANLNVNERSAVTPYLTVDLLHDFFPSSQTSVGDTSVTANPAKTSYQFGAGATTSIGKSSELYFNVKYAHNIGGEYQRNIYGLAGYRYSW